MKGIVVVVVLCLALTAPVWAENVISMPVADHPGAGNAELHFIYWDLGGPPGPENGQISQFFVGVTDRLEIDLQNWKFQGLDSMNVVDGYYWLVKESPKHPSLVVGATNLFGEDLPPSPEGAGFDNRVSPFVIGAYNIGVPAGPPTLGDPLVRLYMGFGWRWHDNDPFGGLLFVVDPKVALAVLNYQGQPAYLAAYKPTPRTEIHVGWFHGEPLVHLGWNFDLGF